MKKLHAPENNQDNMCAVRLETTDYYRESSMENDELIKKRTTVGTAYKKLISK